MTVQNALEEMKERAFAPAFQKYLSDTYKVLAQTDFSEEEKDYTAAEDYFTTTLEQSENEILRQIKTNYEAKLRYASRYAFNAGLYSGFVQHFSNQDLVVDGFEKHLMQDLFEMPGMQRHTLFLKMHDENKKLIEQLEIDGDEERREHLTSIECAWEQRVHWAACHSFYCGYRAAVKVLNAVEGVSTFDMVPHTLLLEYHLGYGRMCKAMVPIWINTVATNSSAGTIPITMDVTTNRMGLPFDLTSFSIPLGATINLCGAAIYKTILAFFVAEIYGLTLSVGQIAMVISISTLMSIAAPGIPGGGIVTGAIFLNLLNLPMDLMGPIAGMYKLIDMSHTTLNVSGDVLGTLFVAKNEKIWNAKAFNEKTGDFGAINAE